MLRRAAVLVISSSFAAVSLSAQSSPQGPHRQVRTNFAGEVSVALPPAADAQKEFVFHRIRGMVEDISSFQSDAVKAGGIAQIADIAWTRDPEYTRELFTRALGLTAVKGDEKNARALAKLRRDIIARIARHDARWAKHLIDSTAGEGDEKQGAAEKRELDIEIAGRLGQEDPALAAEFAARSLRGGVSPGLVWFLKSLRGRDEASANRLFLQSLDRLAQQPVVDAGGLAMLGTFLFTSPKLDGGDPNAVMMTRVGDVGIVDITADLPGASPSLVRPYLRTASTVLNRQMNDPQQRKVGYALGHLLMPRARAVAPDLVAPLGAAMAQLSAQVPPAMTQEAAFANVNKRAADSPEQIMSNAEKLPDSESRDVAFLDVASRAWLNKDFATAEVACARIENRDARLRLETLIEFGRASAKIKDDGPQLFEAAEMANKLPQGVERAVLFLGISEAASKGKNAALANESAARAHNAALSVTDARKPYLLLLAAGQLARHDAVAAESAFDDGIRGLNASGGKAPSGVEWNQKVQAGPLVEDFPLSVAGLDFSFNKAFRSILSLAGVDGGISRARELKSEQLRMSAFVALTDELLKTVPEEGQSGEAVVRVGEDGMRRSAERTVMPVYPKEPLKKDEQQGVAVVEAQYNGRGEVTDAVVLEAPAPSLGQAAVVAVRQWKFKPSSLEGKPISVRGKLTFYFVVDKAKKGRVENPKQFQ